MRKQMPALTNAIITKRPKIADPGSVMPPEIRRAAGIRPKFFSFIDSLSLLSLSDVLIIDVVAFYGGSSFLWY